MTDSEPVPGGKGEKHPREGSEKFLKPNVYKPWKHYAFGNVRPRAFCIMILRVTVSGKVKSLDEAEAKASLNRASSRMS